MQSTKNKILKTSLAYLPQTKQEQLAQITEVIVKAVKPEMIILFGSYARNTWVHDRHTEGQHMTDYISDYDILVITNNDEERDEHELEDMVESKCKFKAPVTVIVHNIETVNLRLSENHYFFSDIKKEGVLLYDSSNYQLAEARILTPAEKQKIAKDDYEYWFTSAADFMEGVDFYFAKSKWNMTAFQLHQATERAYHALELVFTGYKPRTHNLGKLYRMTKSFSDELPGIFPQNDRQEKHLFKQLKNAYVDSRYKKTYHITEPELTTLIERVKKLHEITERICIKKIEELGSA